MIDYTKEINLRLTGISECLTYFPPQWNMVASTLILKEEMFILAHNSHQFQFIVSWPEGRMGWQRCTAEVHGAEELRVSIHNMQAGKQKNQRRSWGGK